MFQKILETSLTGLTTSFSGNRIADLEFIHISLQCFIECYETFKNSFKTFLGSIAYWSGESSRLQSLVSRANSMCKISNFWMNWVFIFLVQRSARLLWTDFGPNKWSFHFYLHSWVYRQDHRIRKGKCYFSYGKGKEFFKFSLRQDLTRNFSCDFYFDIDLHS